MKKSLFKVLAVILVFLFSVSIVACNNSSDTTQNVSSKNDGLENINTTPNESTFGDITSNKPSHNDSVAMIQKSTFKESKNKYKVVDSFVLDDERYFYFYHIGTIDYVPLNIHNAEGVFFNGNEITLEFKMTTINKNESIKEITSAIESSVDLTTTSYVQSGVEAELFGFLEANVESGIKNQMTNTISNTASESYSMSVSNSSLYEKTITYTMDKDDPVGFYFYTPVASVRVYEVVVYNPNTDKVEYMSTYNQYGAAIPGLFYSEYSLIDFGEYNVSFDESMLPEFERPKAQATSDLVVSIDGNGAACDVTEWRGKIGQVYGTLPILERHGYKFVGWSANGVLVNNDSVAIPSQTLVAQWELVTSIVCKTTGSVSVNAGHKLNPFGLVFFGTTGESNTSFDKILNNFDLAALKAEGYRMRIVLEYDVKNTFNFGVGLKYNIAMKSNNKTIANFSEGVNSTNYVSKKNYSNFIDLNDVMGSLEMEISTKNIVNVTITNMIITVEFVKE